MKLLPEEMPNTKKDIWELLREGGWSQEQRDLLIQLFNTINSSREKKNIRKKHRKVFTNDIIKRLEEKSYTIGWRKEIIHDISIELNEYYSNIILSSKLKGLIKQILMNHNIPVTKKALEGYRAYFEENGQLDRQEKKSKHEYVYHINRKQLIPKQKKKKSLGVLDELGMS